MTRKEANMEIVRLIVNYINMYPDQRFGQILMNLDIIKNQGPYETMESAKKFYEEPTDTLERVKNTLRGKYD